MWSGTAVSALDGSDQLREIKLYPQPLTKDLPIWITAAGNPDTFKKAGEMGANLLTHLLVQDIDELARKIGVYREALKQNGHDLKHRKITLMLHTFIGDKQEQEKGRVKENLRNYLSSHVSLLGKINSPQGDTENAYVLERAVDRVIENSLIGTVDGVLPFIQKLRKIGVTEFACLIDFGLDSVEVLDPLTRLNNLKKLVNEKEFFTPVELDIDEIRKYLLESMPKYHIPTEYRILDFLPLSSAKKINRALLKTSDKKLSGSTPLEEINERARAILTIFQQILNKADISINDNFFNVGGAFTAGH